MQIYAWAAKQWDFKMESALLRMPSVNVFSDDRFQQKYTYFLLQAKKN